MSAALAVAAAPPADPSPPPACVVHDRSGGYCAPVTRYAVRRFADRVLGLEDVLEGLSDRDAVSALPGMGVDVRPSSASSPTTATPARGGARTA